MKAVPQQNRRAPRRAERTQRRAGPVQAEDDSLAPILELGSAHRTLTLTLAVVGALLVHGTAAARAATSLFDVGDYARQVRTHVVDRLRLRVDIDVDQPKPEPKPPEPEPEPPAPEPEPKPAAEPLPKEFDEPPLATDQPPPAAEAAKVLTQEPDPDEPLDLTNEGFISGSGTRFAGGVTAADGTSKTAVRSQGAKAGGVPGGKATEPAKPAARAPQEDLSESPKPVQRGRWDCPFPAEADVEQVNYARVTLVVVVDSNGRAKSASVLSEPGYGFGQAARRCALSKQYSVGKDRLGRPVTKTTPPIAVVFRR